MAKGQAVQYLSWKMGDMKLQGGECDILADDIREAWVAEVSKATSHHFQCF